MVDPYLLTAPVLLLGIVILLRFVGCSFTASGAASQVTLTAEACNGKVNLSWITSAVFSDSSYEINRNGNPLPNATGLTNTFYTDTQVTNGTTYSYTVTWFSGGTSQATSKAVSAT